MVYISYFQVASGFYFRETTHLESEFSISLLYLSISRVSAYIDVREICIERGRSIALTIPCWLVARSEPEKGEKQNGIMVRWLKGETKDEVGGRARERSAIYAPPVIEFP